MHLKQKVFLHRPQGTATAAAPPLLSLQPASAQAAVPRANAPAPPPAAVVWQPRAMWTSTAALGSAPGAQGTSCRHNGQLNLTWRNIEQSRNVQEMEAGLDFVYGNRAGAAVLLAAAVLHAETA